MKYNEYVQINTIFTRLILKPVHVPKVVCQLIFILLVHALELSILVEKPINTGLVVSCALC